MALIAINKPVDHLENNMVDLDQAVLYYYTSSVVVVQGMLLPSVNFQFCESET